MDLSQKHFERASQHHATLAKRHHAMIKIARGGMAKTDVDPQDVLDEVLEEIQAIAEEHEEMSTHCSKCAKSAGEEAMERAERADKDRFSAALAPDGVRKTVPTVPRAGFTAVTRAGQPPIAAPVVDDQFKKLVEVEHAEELSLQK